MDLTAAYEPESFRREARRFVDGLADYLKRAFAEELPVLARTSPEAMLAQVTGEFPAAPAEDIVDALLGVVERAHHVHHPGYVGHQVSVPVPMAALAEATSALLSNGMAIFEMGPVHTAMEMRVLAHLASALGLPAETGGVMTHGGTLGNFTALLAARQAKAGHDVWTEGQREPLAVLVSEQAHYCIARAAQCMGWGAEGAFTVPTDERFRMRPDALEERLLEARARGRRVIAVVGTACTTATGSFDPLEPIAEFCQRHDLWFHVDAAHGGSLAWSARHRPRLRGVERADSVVWDLHKLGGLPALNTTVLFRDPRRSYEAFAQEASYLFEGERPEESWYDLGQRTFECTKRGMGVTAYCMLRALGTDWFAANVDTLIARTAELASLLRAAPDFELAVEPEANILCFRHLPADGPPSDEHQRRLRARLVTGGRFYVVQTRLRGETWLRVTLMNPMTSTDHLDALVAELRGLADDPPGTR